MTVAACGLARANAQRNTHAAVCLPFYELRGLFIDGLMIFSLARRCV